MPESKNPTLYQINTRVCLTELSAKLGRTATLDDIADDCLDDIADAGFEWVWMMGVWQTGPAGQQVSRTNAEWRSGYKVVLPDFTDEDVCGSPFAIQRYALHRDFGNSHTLPRLRQRMADRGLSLLLDFVPNHTALDHPWVWQHPEFYVGGDDTDLAREPQNYYRAQTGSGGRVLAHGRDPYFPGWPDTLQLNYRHPRLRQAVIMELQAVAAQCDGVRCDMAMLMLPDVFVRTWGDRSIPNDGTGPSDSPFWPDAISEVRKRRPTFLLMAEVYWDLEWALHQQGFDYTYDKRLYDRLRSQDAGAVRGHLHADLAFQRKSVRFLENHDEPRAAAEFPPDIHRAAALIAYLVPGLRFFHDGQFDGRRIKTSLHLRRRKDEPVDVAIHDFYKQLLECLKRSEVRNGDWRLCECRTAGNGSATWQNLVVCGWEFQDRRLLVAVNYGPTQGQCHVNLPFGDLRGRRIVLRDLLSAARYERDGDELNNGGLYLDLPAWSGQVFEVQAN